MEVPRPVALGGGSGLVVEFDDPRGIGTVAGDDGSTLPFHCTSITDGTRTIPVGTRVTWRIAAGRLGRWEAVAITAAAAITGED